MSIRFACPSCNAILKVAEEKAGKKGHCPRCGQRLQSPRLENVTMLTVPLDGSPTRSSKRPIILVGVLVSAAAMALVFWLVLSNADFLQSGKAVQKDQTVPKLAGNEQNLVKDYLKKNLNDPSDMEFVEWREPRLVMLTKRKESVFLFPESQGANSGYEPGIILSVRFRARNAAGAKVLQEGTFLIQDGKVTQARIPGQPALPVERKDDHVDMEEIACEQVEGKFVKVVVEGEITRRGKPFTHAVIPHVIDASQAKEIPFLPLGGRKTGNPTTRKYSIPGVIPGECRMAFRRSVHPLRNMDWPPPVDDPNNPFIPHQEPKTPYVDNRAKVTEFVFWTEVVFFKGYAPATTRAIFNVTDKAGVQHFDFDLDIDNELWEQAKK